MPIASFSAGSSNSLLAQPSGAGQKLYLRSTASGDTSQTLTLHGNVASVYDTDVVTLLGQREVQSVELFQTLLQAVLSATAIGVVKLYAPGVAATGSIRVDTVPADGTTLSVGLVGFTQLYTFRSPARMTFTPGAGSTAETGANPASFFRFTFIGAEHYFWLSNGTTTNPAPGGTGHAVVFTGAEDAAALAALFLTAINIVFSATLLVAQVSATLTMTGIPLSTISASDYSNWGSDPGLVNVAGGTADAANQIRTGYHTDGVAASLTNIADYIDRAHDASGTAGTHYGTGTAANLFLSGSAATGICTLIDRIMCARQLAWSVTQSSTHFTIASPAGGVDGTQLANLAAGITQAHNTVNFGSNEALATANLPANFVFTSNWVQIGGGSCAIHLNATGGQEFFYDTATDTTVPRAGSVTLPLISSFTIAVPTETNIEYIRLRTTNATGSAKNVHAKVVYR